MQKRWNINDNIDYQAVNSLAQDLGVSTLIAKMLVQRGVNTYNEAKDFFRPSLENLHNPFLMKGMQNAIDRIFVALENNEKIMIYGDYDVDGTTSVALVYSYFSRFYNNIGFYIPDRYKEGYGISFDGIDFAADNDFKLIIALDCGIKAIDKIEYATKKGIDFIICDHHLPGAEVPKAVAVLDPKQSDCSYPYKELSGCGIGFKLVQALASQSEDLPQDFYDLLDLAVVSIAADIVPITGENRILAHFGLNQLNTNPRNGFKAIMELVGVKKELTISDIVFTIAPRINAAGRLESGNMAVELLLTDTVLSATESGAGLNLVNTERKTIDTQITLEAFAMIENDEVRLKQKSTVLFNGDWHKGVVGIVASRLTERFYRPTIVLTESNGLVTGSARSVKDFDVYNAIEACSELLEQFGGHKYAAGLTLKPENLEAFQNKFEEVVQSTIQEYMLTPEIEIDAEIELKDIDGKLYRILKQFAPFGPGNMSPVFLTKHLTDFGNAKIIGEKHLKFDAWDAKANISFPAIAFGFADKYDNVTKGSFDLCYSIEENNYRGLTTLQFVVKDIR
ncbi:MAG: single-stranded-DNA-specific exonuclease RecJ [Bacteroidota bacterium]